MNQAHYGSAGRAHHLPCGAPRKCDGAPQMLQGSSVQGKRLLRGRLDRNSNKHLTRPMPLAGPLCRLDSSRLPHSERHTREQTAHSAAELGCAVGASSHQSADQRGICGIWVPARGATLRHAQKQSPAQPRSLCPTTLLSVEHFACPKLQWDSAACLKVAAAAVCASRR